MADQILQPINLKVEVREERPVNLAIEKSITVGVSEDDVTTAVDTAITAEETARAAADTAIAASIPVAVKEAQYRKQRPQINYTDTIMTILAAGHGWTKQSTNGSSLDDTVDFVKGKQSLKMTSAGNGINDTINYRSPVMAAIDATGKSVRITYKPDDRTKLNKAALFLYTNGGTSKSFFWTFDHGSDLTPIALNGQFTSLTLSFGNASTANSPDITQITGASLQFSDNGTPVSVHLNGISFFNDGSSLNPNGIISLGFDDNLASQASNALPVLDAAGYHATFNIIWDQLGQSGKLTLADLHRLHDIGRHEIAAHAYTLANHNLKFDQLLAQQGEQALVTEVTNLINALQTNGFPENADVLALPNGSYDAATLAILSRFFAYIRTIYAHQGQYHETIPVSNPLAIRAISGISSIGSINLAAVTAFIDRVKSSKGWGLITFHDIVTGTPTTTNQCSLSDFQAIIDYLKNVGGIDVRPMGDVMRSGNDTSLISKASVDTSLATKANTTHTHIEADVTNLTSDLAAKEATANKGQANGYASLDGSAKVPAAQLPSYVDDVLEYANTAAFPATGTTGIIYVADDTGKIYRWGGSSYVEISPSPGSTDSVPEGSTNKYFTPSAAKAAAVSDSITDAITDIAPSQNAVFDALALKEALANKDTDTALAANSDTKYPSQRAARGYIDTQVATKPSLGNTIPVFGSGGAPTAGVAATAAKSDHAHPRYAWEPPDYGLISWAFNPENGVNATALGTAGLLYTIRLHNPLGQSVTNLHNFVVTIGSGLTSGQCFGALYQNGNLLGVTPDQSTAWTSTGFKTMAIVGGPVATVVGDVDVAFWFNGTTGPALARDVGTIMGNLGLTGNNSRFATADTGKTTTAPGTLGTKTAYTLAYWAAIS